MIIANKDERAILLANYIVSTSDTIRGAAKVFGISKSTVHLDVTKRLVDLDPILANNVKDILDKNLKEWSLRGGLATKKKYSKKI